MERVGTLIQKLTEQYRSQAALPDLLQTTQCLLHSLQAEHFPATQIRGKVSVILPNRAAQMPIAAASPALENQATEEHVDLPVTNAATFTAPEEAEITAILSTDNNQVAEALQAAFAVPEEKATVDLPIEQPGILNQIFADQATATKEVYALYGAKTEQQEEVMTLLEDSPIRDLRKAIATQERNRFIHELFRGDDNMFERSIRTINGFNIYAEAQYWIQRELKVKLGWEDHPESARQFDHLVSRRFS